MAVEQPIDFAEASARLRQQNQQAESLNERSGGPGGGGGDDMEQRVKALEDRVGEMRESLASIKATLDHMAANLATKADVHALEARVNGLGLKLTWAAISAVIASAGLVFGIVRFTTPPSGPPNVYFTLPPAVTAPAPAQAPAAPARQP